MCGSMVDIQSPTAEIRQGKKERKKKPQDENIMVCPITQGDHNKKRHKHFVTFKKHAIVATTSMSCMTSPQVSNPWISVSASCPVNTLTVSYVVTERQYPVE